MITLSKIGNAIRFTFADSQHYLTGDGTIDVPVNSLSLIFDESTFATFKKAASNDIFVSAPLDEFGMTKAELITFYTTNMVGSTGGGGGGGVTSGEVQTMIDNSISGKADTSAVTSAVTEITVALSGKAETSDVTSAVTELNAALSGETARAMASEEALSGAVSAVTDALEDKVDVSELEEVELAVAQSINVLAQSVSGKQDTLVYYYENTENNEGMIETSVEDGGVTKTSDVIVTSNMDGDSYVELSALEHSDDYDKSAAFYGTQDGIEISYGSYDNVEGTSINHTIYVNADGFRVETNSDDGESVNTTEFSVTPDGVTINGDEIVTESDLTASLSGKQDTLVAGSGITISGNVISADGGGGGATYSAGTNISIDTANTINCTLNLVNGGGTNSVKMKSTNSSNGTNSFAIGSDGVKASGLGSFAGGSYSEANKMFSMAFGRYAKANNYAEVALGNYNKSNGSSTAFTNSSGDTLFSVGNGTNAYGGEHNAFEIRQNGDIYCSDGTNDVKLQDTITATAENTTALGGLKLVKLTQSEYDALVTKDPDTLYIITNVVNNS